MEYFNEGQLEITKKQRKKLLTVYLIIVGIFVLASIGFVTWRALLPYKSTDINIIKAIHYPLTAIFVIFSFVFMGIPFKRTNKFYKLCVNLKEGQRETSTGSFFEYDGELQIKDGVEMKALIFLEWNKYKNDFFERKVLVFYEKPFP